LANLSNWWHDKYNVTYIIKMDWNKRITPKDAQKMVDAYAKVYAPKEEPKPETEAKTESDTPTDAEKTDK